MIKIYPSLMAANLVNLAHEIKQLEPYCDGFHLDVMDFHFVPNLTFGPDMINAMRHVTKKPLWVHLMVDEPERYIPRLQLHANDILSIHYEACKPTTITLLLKLIKGRSWHASLALKPTTSIEVIIPYIQVLDLVLLMSVEPGFSGQTFETSTPARLKNLVDLKTKHNAHFSIGMDGGINEKNIKQLVEMGVQDMGIGSAIFGHNEPVANSIRLQKIATQS